MEPTYLGTATLALRLGKTTLLTDPVFDPAGSTDDFGLWFTPRVVRLRDALHDAGEPRRARSLRRPPPQP